MLYQHAKLFFFLHLVQNLYWYVSMFLFIENTEKET